MYMLCSKNIPNYSLFREYSQPLLTIYGESDTFNHMRIYVIEEIQTLMRSGIGMRLELMSYKNPNMSLRYRGKFDVDTGCQVMVF